MSLSEKAGLTGSDLLEFVKEQQAYEREERAQAAKQRKAAEEAALLQREKKLELKKMEVKIARLQNVVLASQSTLQQGKAPKLPTFVDGKDELDS